MGMYDYIKTKYPLPSPYGQFQDKIYQTKDTPNQFLDNYTIDENGQLLVEEYDTEDRSDPNAVGLERIIGCMTRVNKRMVNSNFSGAISFYDAVDERHISGGVSGWIEFAAVFREGILVGKIELVKYEAPAPEEVIQARIKEIEEVFRKLAEGD